MGFNKRKLQDQQRAGDTSAHDLCTDHRRSNQGRLLVLMGAQLAEWSVLLIYASWTVIPTRL